MPTEVHLIGEHHLDMMRSYRYSRALNRISPDIVSLEMDRSSAEKSEADFREYLTSRFGSPDNLERIGINKHNTLALRDFQGLSLLSATINYRRNKKPQIAYNDSASEELHDTLRTFLSDPETEDDEHQDQLAWEDFFNGEGEIAGYTLRKVVGDKNFERFRMEGLTVTQAIFCSYEQLALTNSLNGLFVVNGKFDTMYYNDICEIGDEFQEEFELESRDRDACEKIMSMEGRVLHGGGLSHIYGNHNNLYDRLKSNGVNVRRHKLIDFGGNLIYRLFVRGLAHSYNRKYLSSTN